MVRRAIAGDIPSIVNMLKDYSQHINIKCAADVFSVPKVSKLVSLCINQGYVWVFEKDGEIIGSLVAREQVNLFTDGLLETQLVALYVKPEYRNGTIGGRLLLSYDKQCEENGIRVSWIGAQVTTELNNKSLDRLGYKLSEQSFIKER